MGVLKNEGSIILNLVIKKLTAICKLKDHVGHCGGVPGVEHRGTELSWGRMDRK